MTHPTNRTAGFTILELLISLTIVAILMALGLGVIGQIRSRGHDAECVSNLRQLVAANMAHAADNNGDFAPAQDRFNRVRWHGARSGRRGGFDPTEGYLAPYLGHSGEIKMCPALRDALGSSQGSFEEGTGGYGYNHSYVGGSPHKAMNDPARFEPRKMLHIQNPSRTVMFADSAFPKRDGVQEYAYCEPFFHVEPGGELGGRADPSVHFRHNGRAHVAWCDGHVTAEEPTKIEGTNIYGGNNEEYLVGWFGPEEDNGFWNPNSAAAQGDYEE